jgi:hypothetical protein
MPSYSIDLSEDKKFVILKVSGMINRQLALSYNLEAHTFGAARGVDRFLLDFTDCRNTDTVLRNFTFVNSDMKTPGINWSARVAMLVSPHDRSHDFIEALFRAAGADVTLFHDRDLAVWHLTGKAG